MNIDKFLVAEDQKVKLKDFATGNTSTLKKADAELVLQEDVLKLRDLQSKLYAENTYAVLLVLQGIDAAGKDGLIKHVMAGLNPSGCQVKSFKVPSTEELDHDYLWRYVRALPERGNIGIFNRSHYEEVLVVRVHPELLGRQRVPDKNLDKLWDTRFREIRHFERYLVSNGVVVLKFFLHLSKEEQKKRFLARLDSPDKNWKFSEADVHERAFWDDYTLAFEDMLSHTSTSHAPWHIIPADDKWYARLVAANIIVSTLEGLKLAYPKLGAEELHALERAKKVLEKEK